MQKTPAKERISRVSTGTVDFHKNAYHKKNELSLQTSNTEQQTPPETELQISPNALPKSNQKSPTKVKLRKKIKTLQQKLRRRNKKINNLKDLITTLKDKKYLSNGSAEILLDQFSGVSNDIFKNQIKNNKSKPTGRRYSEELKKFALTVNFYSPKAYNFLRRVFYLPHQSSIRQWASTVNCEPGFFSEVFQDLNIKITKNQEKWSDCALLLDGMSIRKQILYDPVISKYTGFIDYGNLFPENSENTASDALVFMLVGLKSYWKTPAGYFLTNKCDSETQASLIKTCLMLCADNQLRVWSVTCDGTSANISTLRILGCNFTNDFQSMNVKFKHPTRDYFVYSTLDACHMLKLARNALGDIGSFKSPDGKLITWKNIKDLHVLQTNEGFNLANKIHVDHINWHKNKMKVKLAAQTLSSSVADALEYLQNDAKHENFKNCSGTIEFIRHIDRLFDILNSRHPMMKGFKSPISKANLEMLKTLIPDISKYFLTLLDNQNQPLIYHRRKTFIIGFVSTAKALLQISEELLYRQENSFSYVLTYKFSQDHIELLFSCIRSRGGFNNNPNILQFKTALKQILMRNSILASNKANVLCFESENQGSIFSFKNSKRRTPVSEMFDSQLHSTTNTENDEEILKVFQSTEISMVTSNVLYYIAGFIVRSISKSIDCNQCSQALVLPRIITEHQYFIAPYAGFTNRKNRGGLVQSSDSVYKVIVNCEKAFKINVLNQPCKISLKSNLLQKMLIQVVSSCDWSHHFPQFNDHVYHIDIGFEDDHVTQIVKRIATKYFNMRLHTYAKRFTREIVNKNNTSVRRQLSKLILFKNV